MTPTETCYAIAAAGRTMPRSAYPTIALGKSRVSISDGHLVLWVDDLSSFQHVRKNVQGDLYRAAILEFAKRELIRDPQLFGASFERLAWDTYPSPPIENCTLTANPPPRVPAPTQYRVQNDLFTGMNMQGKSP